MNGEWQQMQQPADVILELTLRDGKDGGGEIVEIYQRDGRTTGELAEMLRVIADGFEQGEVKRIR